MGAGRVPEAVIGPKLRRRGTLLVVIDRTEVLRHLVRIDTTSGNERADIEVTAAFLDRITSRDETRQTWWPGYREGVPLPRFWSRGTSMSCPVTDCCPATTGRSGEAVTAIDADGVPGVIPAGVACQVNGNASEVLWYAISA